MDSPTTIRRTGVLFSLALLAAALTGCGASRLIGKGDANLLADRPHRAVRFYREALHKDSDLGDDPEFIAKLKRARRAAAYEDGSRLAEKGQWEQAIESFAESLRIDPTFQQASAALARAKRRAATVRYRRALERADDARLDQAAAELRHALRLDPGHADARAALDSVTAAPGAGGRACGLYDEAMALKSRKRWLKASEILQSAVEADPNHLPSRAGRKACKDAMARASDHYAEGSRLLAADRLDDALAALRRAVEIWPACEQAGKLLSRAEARRKQFDDLYAQAAKLLQAGRWDDAIERAQAALKILPRHRRARELLTQATLNAAAIQVDNGRRLLAMAGLDEAERRFGRALTYVPNMQAARDGLGQVYFLRGRDAERRCLWGNALLWYMQAGEHARDDEYRSAIRRARSKLTQRVSFALGLKVNDPALQSRLTGRLFAVKPGYVTLLGGRGRGGEPEPDFTAVVELARLDVRDKLVRTEHRVHRYSVERHFPNPRIPRLRRLLDEARRELARLRRAYGQTCAACRGKGKTTCGSCAGKGSLPCGNCRSKGRLTCPKCKGAGTVGESLCRRCKGIGAIVCDACRGAGRKHCPACSSPRKKRGWVGCKPCRGTGRRSRVKRSDIREKEGRVSQLGHQLGREPAMVVRQIIAEWPYAVLHYEKVGTIAAGVRLIDAATGAVLATSSVGKSADYGDSMTTQANPSLGVHADRLELPRDDDVRNALLDAAAEDAARRILAAAIDARVAQFNTRAKQLERAGKTDRAVEELVNVAVLMQSTNPAEAARILRKLRK